MSQTIRKQHDKHERVQKTCGGGRTHQSFKDDCDINKIIAKYKKTGQLPDVSMKQALYGDFSSSPSFQEAQNLVIKVNAQFASLDARLRERFANKPQKFLEWVNDPSNAEEMAELGLMKAESVQRVANAKKEALKSKPEAEKKPEAK